MLTDGRTTDAGVTGILIAHLGAFGSGELKNKQKKTCTSLIKETKSVTMNFFEFFSVYFLNHL